MTNGKMLDVPRMAAALSGGSAGEMLADINRPLVIPQPAGIPASAMSQLRSTNPQAAMFMDDVANVQKLNPNVGSLMGKTTSQIMAGRNPHAAMRLADPMNIAKLNPNIMRYGDDVTVLSRVMGPLRRTLSDIGGRRSTPSFAPARGGLGGMPEVRTGSREMGFQFRRERRETGQPISSGPVDTRSYMRAQKRAERTQIRAQLEYAREQNQAGRRARREA